MADIGPCYFVIFGATGNLATRKLLPALCQLDDAGRLHDDLRFIAFARRDWQHAEWLAHLDKCCASSSASGSSRRCSSALPRASTTWPAISTTRRPTGG
jgi:glucose-6-phosphate 1-dehydrogenase